ncbi:MAG: glucose-1-phosphate cytidylyltransferase [Magnetococcales bacterium]|nr:glucose-1-phosphate cytidylyltransferase [Magnetococcales bacterium]
MKAVILAGGLGTRLSEETDTKPKPMVEVGDKPILWHIMKIYSSHGIHDFVVCCGYKGYMIKEYFSNYLLHVSDVTFSLADNHVAFHNCQTEPWRITLVDTGVSTMTGGRLRRVRDYVKDEACFCFTYGDGVADVDIQATIAFHRQHGKLATMTVTRPMARFGAVAVVDGRVEHFKEKPTGDQGLVNGGFFVLSPQVIDLIADDTTTWEQEPLETLAKQQQLMAYQHDGFWQPMDTLRDKRHLESLWQSGQAPWKRW